MVQARQSIQLPSATASEQAYVVHARVDERQSIQLSSATARRTYSSITFPAPAASVDPTSLSHCETGAVGSIAYDNARQSIQLPSATARRYCPAVTATVPVASVDPTSLSHCEVGFLIRRTSTWTGVSRSNFPQPLRGRVARDLATKGFATRFASTYRQRGRWIAPSTSHTNASSFPAGAYGAASSRRVFDATSPLALSKGNWIGPGRPTTLRSKTQSAGRMSL